MATKISLYGFASRVSPTAVKEFLEVHTGEGSVSDVKVGQNKGSRAHAIVEFTTVEAAEHIKCLASQRLCYGNSYLQASDAQRRTPRYAKRGTPHHNLGDDVNLNFGRHISKDKFSVLWSQENVSVKLCLDIGKFEFFLSYESADYKLELSHESIWQIELHRPRGHSVKYLVMQLYGIPMIYENEIHRVREVDFALSSSIEQSTAICLELPSSAHIPMALKDFFYYKESSVQFTLVPGSVFSCNSDLVPMTDGKKKDKKRKRKRKAPFNQVNKAAVKCFFCKNKGHMKKACPEKNKGHMKKACPQNKTWLVKKGLLEPKETSEQ